MKTFKKNLLSAFMVGMLAIGGAACGGDDGGEAETTATEGGAAATEGAGAATEGAADMATEATEGAADMGTEATEMGTEG